MQNFWVTNKEYYGMLWYFLEWSIIFVLPPYKRDQVNVPPCEKCFFKTCSCSIDLAEMVRWSC